ncbi:MAG: SRPBCC family protein [Cytophagaceae bacterium]|nr:MAG: SRPBCC family protein [Cytophagaceae bacterium]
MTTTSKAERDESIGQIGVETSIDMAAAPHDVYEFWRALENFPRFMSHVEEVRATAPNRYLWRVRGPLGSSFSWEADVTHVEPDARISWRSTDDAEIVQTGTVFFEATQTGGTHLKVQMSYTITGLQTLMRSTSVASALCLKVVTGMTFRKSFFRRVSYQCVLQTIRQPIAGCLIHIRRTP